MLKTLQSLLLLREEDVDIAAMLKPTVDALRKGYEDAGKRYDNAEKERKTAEKEAEKKKNDAARAAKSAEQKAAKEAEHAAKLAAKEHKLKSAEALAELDEDIEAFIANLIDRFPYYGGAGGAEDILDKYKTREVALVAMKSFRQIAERIGGLTKGMNASFIAAGRATAEELAAFQREAQSIANGKSMPADIIDLVKSEATFFKQLFKVRDDFRLDEADFKRLLAIKMNKTSGDKKAAAARALNIFFTYVQDEMIGHAKVIASAGRQMDDEERASKKALRDKAAAKVAAEVEAKGQIKK